MNTSLLLQAEPECNRLDLLGGRVVPLSADQGILVASSDGTGATVAFDACDAVSPPVFIEESRGLIDFDAAWSMTEPSIVEVYWIARDALFATTIDAISAERVQPIRRLAEISDPQSVRATVSPVGRFVVVTTDDAVVAVAHRQECGVAEAM